MPWVLHQILVVEQEVVVLNVERLVHGNIVMPSLVVLLIKFGIGQIGQF